MADAFIEDARERQALSCEFRCVYRMQPFTSIARVKDEIVEAERAIRSHTSCFMLIRVSSEMPRKRKNQDSRMQLKISCFHEIRSSDLRSVVEKCILPFVVFPDNGKRVDDDGAAVLVVERLIWTPSVAEYMAAKKLTHVDKRVQNIQQYMEDLVLFRPPVHVWCWSNLSSAQFVQHTPVVSAQRLVWLDVGSFARFFKVCVDGCVLHKTNDTFWDMTSATPSEQLLLGAAHTFVVKVVINSGWKKTSRRARDWDNCKHKWSILQSRPLSIAQPVLLHRVA